MPRRRSRPNFDASCFFAHNACIGIDRAQAVIFAAAGIPEYWIVIPDSRTVEIFRRPGPAGYGERLAVSAADATLQPDGLAMPPLPREHVFGS